MKWPCNSKSRRKGAYRVPQIRNLDGNSMNIYEESFAYYFRVQSEREWTLAISPGISKIVKGMP